MKSFKKIGLLSILSIFTLEANSFNNEFLMDLEKKHINFGLFDKSEQNFKSNKKLKRILGKILFYDKSLSLNKTMSCASCHNPKHAFIDARFKNSLHPVGGAVSIGDDGVALGGRNSPTLSYAKFSPKFHFDHASKSYVGGQFHDGRARGLARQAMGPPLDSNEMMMPNKKSVIKRIEQNPYYRIGFKKVFGKRIFKNNNKAYEAMGKLIASYERSKEFSPFDSKYDRFLECKKRGNNDEFCYIKGKWTEAEKLGMNAFFKSPRSNCRTCHTLKSPFKKRETFTDYKYYNIGVPRNPQLLSKKGLSSTHVDHGIYGREDIDDASLDGAFKTPTLRNIAVTAPYMHNGVFKELRTVLAFYIHISNLDESGNSPIPNNPETGMPWGEPEVENTIRHDILDNTTTTPSPITPEQIIVGLEAFFKTLTDKKYEHLLTK